MTIRTHTDLAQLKKNFKTRGFNKTFELQGECLFCKERKKHYLPQELLIVEYHHLHKTINKHQPGIIFAISCTDGTKGVLNFPTNELNGIKLLKFTSQVKIKLSETQAQK